MKALEFDELDANPSRSLGNVTFGTNELRKVARRSIAPETAMPEYAATSQACENGDRRADGHFEELADECHYFTGRSIRTAVFGFDTPQPLQHPLELGK